MQMLWDRGEPDGYAERMTGNPLPDTPAHQVLMDVAFGDHQVTDYQADVEARTIGASAHRPALYNGPLAEHQRAVERARDQPLPVHGLGGLLLGHRADPRKPGRLGHNSSAPNRRRMKTCRTAPAKTRTARRGRRRPSSSSSPTSSTGRS